MPNPSDGRPPAPAPRPPADTPPAAEEWLTVAEVAEELRLNPATIRLWISRGQLKATRAGQRKLLIRRSELDRKLSTSRRYPRPPPDDRLAAIEDSLARIEGLLIKLGERAGLTP